MVAFEGAIDLDPALPSAWLGYAMALRANRNYEDALDAEAKALAIDLENSSAWLSRSRTLSLLFRHEEALAALEKAMLLSPAVAEDWSAWKKKRALLLALDRQNEADAAQKRYRELLEIAAGELTGETSTALSPAQRELLVDKIYCDKGSLEEQERWLAIIQSQENSGDSYEGEALTQILTAKRLALLLREELASPLTREQLEMLVQRLIDNKGTEEEQDVWLCLLAEDTGASQRSIIGDIYAPKQEMTAEEIVERAIERREQS